MIFKTPHFLLVLFVSMFSRYFPFFPSRPVQSLPHLHQPQIVHLPLQESQRCSLYHPTRLTRVHSQSDQERDFSSQSEFETFERWKKALEAFKGQESQICKYRLEELRKKYQKTKTQKDLYIAFITSQIGKHTEKANGLERHHILPQFEGGREESSNLVLLTVEDHLLAHFIRYL